MLANVPQEIDEVEGHEPLGIIEEKGGIRSFETEEIGELSPEPLSIGFYVLFGKKLTLCGLPAGVPDHSRSPADESDGNMPASLEMSQAHDRNDMA
jgi:hypothetical protein